MEYSLQNAAVIAGDRGMTTSAADWQQRSQARNILHFLLELAHANKVLEYFRQPLLVAMDHVLWPMKQLC